MNSISGISSTINVNFIDTGSILSMMLILAGFTFLLAFLLVQIIIVLVNYIKKDNKLYVPGKPVHIPLPPVESGGIGRVKIKIDKKDLVIMGIMTLIYTVIALINLGSFHIPQTSWAPKKTGESFIVDLGKNTEVSRLYYFPGFGEGKYSIQYRNEKGEFVPVAVFEKEECAYYTWKFVEIKQNTNQIKVVAYIPGVTLNEIGIFEEGETKPLKGIKIIKEAGDPEDTGKMENLLDEQDTVDYSHSYLTGTYFDEVYYPRTAYDDLHHILPFETTHPPFGKILIAIGIAIFGMNPFGWRIIGVLFGVAMIPVMYIFGRKFFEGRFYAFCSAFLMMFDFMHFTHTRISTIDVYVTFFIMLMYYYMYKYFSGMPYQLEFKKSLKPLFFCGLFFGFAVASKWIGLYSLPGLVFLFLYANYSRYKTCITLGKKREPGSESLLQGYKPLIYNTVFYWIVFFVTIPGILYILSYIPFLLVPGSGAEHGFFGIIENQVSAFIFHSKFMEGQTHPYASSWWQWPLMIKPLLCYMNTDYASPVRSTIVSMGNPGVWWVGILTTITSLVISIKKRDKNMLIVFTGIICQYLPWILITRYTFIYHYFSTVPFIIFTIVYSIKYLIEKNRYAKYGVYAYLGAVLLLFVLFYPVISGMKVPIAYLEHIRWLKGWSFY